MIPNLKEDTGFVSLNRFFLSTWERPRKPTITWLLLLSYFVVRVRCLGLWQPLCYYKEKARISQAMHSEPCIIHSVITHIETSHYVWQLIISIIEIHSTNSNLWAFLMHSLKTGMNEDPHFLQFVLLTLNQTPPFPKACDVRSSFVGSI